MPHAEFLIEFAFADIFSREHFSWFYLETEMLIASGLANRVSIESTDNQYRTFTFQLNQDVNRCHVQFLTRKPL